MNILPTFWRDFLLCLLAVVALLVVAGLIEITATAILGA